jgi:hypothetical protein
MRSCRFNVVSLLHKFFRDCFRAGKCTVQITEHFEESSLEGNCCRPRSLGHPDHRIVPHDEWVWVAFLMLLCVGRGLPWSALPDNEFCYSLKQVLKCLFNSTVAPKKGKRGRGRKLVLAYPSCFLLNVTENILSARFFKVFCFACSWIVTSAFSLVNLCSEHDWGTCRRLEQT